MAEMEPLSVKMTDETSTQKPSIKSNGQEVNEKAGLAPRKSLSEAIIAYYEAPDEKIEEGSEFKILSISTPNPQAEGDEKDEMLSEIYQAHARPTGTAKELCLPGLPEYLTSSSSHPLQIEILISTLSGAGHALKVHETILSPFLEHFHIPFTTHTTTSASSIVELATSVFRPRALNGEAQTVILLSGDGGVVDILNGLLEPQAHSKTFTRPTLITLPLGTANALFHSLHSSPPDPLPHALRTLFHGRSTPLPTFTARFSPDAHYVTGEVLSSDTVHGAVVCSWALHASLVADSDTPEYRKHGAARFQMAAKENLFPFPHKYQGRITLFTAKSDQADAQIEEKVLERDSYAYLIVTMVSRLESGFVISPASKPGDGKLRALWFGQPEVRDGEEIMTLLTEAYREAKHVEEDGVGYQVVKGLRIEMREDEERFRRICVDGRIVIVAKGGWVEVWDDGKADTPGIDIVV
jgi:diacylglycerol kinase family enzyme